MVFVEFYWDDGRVIFGRLLDVYPYERLEWEKSIIDQVLRTKKIKNVEEMERYGGGDFVIWHVTAYDCEERTLFATFEYRR